MKKLSEIKNWKEIINEVVQGDCLDGMRLIPDKSIQLVITDPPYSDDFATFDYATGRKNPNKKLRHISKELSFKPKEEHFRELLRISSRHLIFGGNHFANMLPPAFGWFFWDKNNGDARFSDGEMIYGNIKKGIRKIKYTWCGAIQENMKNKDVRFHPTQKPVELIRILIERNSKPGDLICDPFMGSWTTARACKDLGRNFIGFELDGQYCRFGEERLRQEILF